MLPNLKKLRMEYGISQQRLADAIHVSQPSINKYENHNIEPDFEILIRMADYFNTSVDYLIGHTENRRKIEYTEPWNLNQEEKEHLTKYRTLSVEERRCVKIVIDTFLQK